MHAVTNETSPRTRTTTWWWGFAVFAAFSTVHIIALAFTNDAFSGPTKLTLMPALALAVIWANRSQAWQAWQALLIIAIFFSWLGDGAGAFFPFAPTLPLMLIFFGIAHLAYIWIFQRHGAVRRQPIWSAAYLIWWALLLVVLWPHLGGLSIAVAIYGLVLVGTAASAMRCHPIVAWGGLLFLVSDSILAFTIFMPDALPPLASPLVMLTYCTGQGLIALGLIVSAQISAPSRAPTRSV
ncbi:lysoplasmalogenase (plasmid) [Coraliomargarita sp. W4R53]